MNCKRAWIIDFYLTIWYFNHPVRSRRDSESSNSSINTLEDLSLAFKLTIAMGEEALDDESEDENVDDNVQGIPNEID